ncbi:MAG: malonyl CoA-acyl carrier protein transacylase, partial [Ahrensia sp.]
MAPAADAMAQALSDVTINAPSVPIVANVLVAPVTDTDQIKQCLVDQVTGQVRWAETIDWFGANGVDTVLEIGAGKVLTGLARRINRDLNGVALGTPDDIETFLNAQS